MTSSPRHCTALSTTSLPQLPLPSSASAEKAKRNDNPPRISFSALHHSISLNNTTKLAFPVSDTRESESAYGALTGRQELFPCGSAPSPSACLPASVPGQGSALEKLQTGNFRVALVT
ncbi:hypothetical protein PO909_027269 [Leuciscus waleckii]